MATPSLLATRDIEFFRPPLPHSFVAELPPTPTFSRPPVVVIDACVFFSKFITELLMNLAGVGALEPRWTNRILEEWMRNVVLRTHERALKDPARHPVTRAALERFVDKLNLSAPMALLPDPAASDEQRFPGVDPKDRHVAAAAWTARASLGFHGSLGGASHASTVGVTPNTPLAVGVVTFNLRDFPEDALAVGGLFRASPDKLLTAMIEWAPEVVFAGILQHHVGSTRPPRSTAEYLAEMRRAKL